MNTEEELKKAIEEMKDEFEIYTLPEYVVCSFEDKIKEIFQAGQLSSIKDELTFLKRLSDEYMDGIEDGTEKGSVKEVLDRIKELTKKVSEEKTE